MSKSNVSKYNEQTVEDKLKPFSMWNKTYSNAIVEVDFSQGIIKLPESVVLKKVFRDIFKAHSKASDGRGKSVIQFVIALISANR